MRLYLSSFRLGEDPELLVRLTGERAHVAVIANAMDDAPADVRRQAVQRELQARQIWASGQPSSTCAATSATPPR